MEQVVATVPFTYTRRTFVKIFVPATDFFARDKSHKFNVPLQLEGTLWDLVAQPKQILDSDSDSDLPPLMFLIKT